MNIFHRIIVRLFPIRHGRYTLPIFLRFVDIDTPENVHQKGDKGTKEEETN